MDREKLRVMSRTGNIFFNISICATILCVIGPIVFSYDMIGFLGSAILFSTLGGFWIAAAILGGITFLVAIDSYRGFLVKLGKFIISIFHDDSTAKIMQFIGEIADYYWIIASLAIISIVGFYLFKGLSHELKMVKTRAVLEAFLSIVCVVSIVLSMVLINRLKSGVL